MRIVLLCLLISGCSVLNGIADEAPEAPRDDRIFLGSNTIFVPQRSAMDRYTCGKEQLVCESVGMSYFCNCEAVSTVRTSP